MHADAERIAGMLIVRPEGQMFFANAERVLGRVRQMAATASPLHTVIVSLEESPDLDGTAVEALKTFALECTARGWRLMLVRLKPDVLAVLRRAADTGFDEAALSELSVDDAVARAAR